MADTSRRDGNYVTTASAKDNSDGSTRYILVDHVTGYVLADFLSVTDTVPASTTGERDDNRVTSAEGKNDSSGEAQGLLIDNRNGRLFCKTP